MPTQLSRTATKVLRRRSASHPAVWDSLIFSQFPCRSYSCKMSKYVEMIHACFQLNAKQGPGRNRLWGWGRHGFSGFALRRGKTHSPRPWYRCTTPLHHQNAEQGVGRGEWGRGIPWCPLRCGQTHSPRIAMLHSHWLPHLSHSISIYPILSLSDRLNAACFEVDQIMRGQATGHVRIFWIMCSSYMLSQDRLHSLT